MTLIFQCCQNYLSARLRNYSGFPWHAVASYHFILLNSSAGMWCISHQMQILGEKQPLHERNDSEVTWCVGTEWELGSWPLHLPQRRLRTCWYRGSKGTRCENGQKCLRAQTCAFRQLVFIVVFLGIFNLGSVEAVALLCTSCRYNDLEGVGVEGSLS